MTLINLTFALAALSFGLCALFFASRMLVPMTRQFLASSSENDSLQTKVFPVLAFVALLGVLAKLTIF